ncbi:hypothetical protein [Streptomyces vilmorinianum]|uniref:hypothetical protein n=1 Tax=Streptomyces vilmorinianum TaxID=3051092 RepID=UPI0010FB00C3|nr:hypothetical protein [Streptomyces vilmorinianum]
MNKRVMRAAVAAVAVGGFVLGTAGPAAAYDDKNGVLENLELGLYYNSGQGGCVFDIVVDNDFADDRFVGNCSGSGQSTNDNTASYRNWAGRTMYVWTDHYQEGIRGSLPAGYVGNASDTFKNKISSSAMIIYS